MITTGMLRRQVWMADDDEFDYVMKNLQRVFGLSIQYENHRYAEEFTKPCSAVYLWNIRFRGGGRFKIFLE